jgi:hypothetical protein
MKGKPWTPKQAYDRARYEEQKAKRLAEALPDPITLLTTEERAYLAGLIDGEGSIYCGAIGSSRNKTCYPCIAIGMTDRPVIEWVASRWGCAVSYVLKRSKNPTWLDQHFVRLSGKRAQLLCVTLLPYLRVKRRQAELVAVFPCEARIAPGEPIDPEINARRYALRDQINGMNFRPRNPAARRGKK